ncbi:MAG: putative secreted protein, partial [Frankiales bacterium]|nr:putative secreted protein [Frankiales bacterium]
MATRDIGVAIGIPEPYTSELQGWRERLGDPNASGIPP